MTLTVSSPAEPIFQLFYRGVDISSELAPHLVSCTYTDKVHGEADDVEVTVQDRDGLWRGAWCPETGDEVTLAIGYKGGVIVPCGSFEIDEPAARLGRGGDSFTFRGQSAPVSKALRTKKTRGFDNQSLKDIAGKVASENGFTIVGTPPDIWFEHQRQRRERDLEFLSRMADDFGAYFSVKGRQLVFAERRELHERPPIFTLRAQSDDYISADLKRGSTKTASKAKASYFDGNQKKTIEVEVEDKDVRNGDTLRIDERVENEGQARAMAKSRLEKANLDKQTGNIVMVGNPLLLAGQVMALDDGFGKWAWRYIIKQSRHHITRSGYTTNIEIAAVGAGSGAGSGKSGSAGSSATGAAARPRSAATSGFALPTQRA